MKYTIYYQCCGSRTFHYGSGYDFSMSSGSGSYFLKVQVSEPTFFLRKYYFKGPKMAFQDLISKEYLNLVPVLKMVKVMKLPSVADPNPGSGAF
jgi:hypothetical protein